MRAGKLFPGPHLYAGMAITGLWAAAAAFVPAMQKGNEGARIAHIALNSITVLLFAWQVRVFFSFKSLYFLILYLFLTIGIYWT